jgi:NTP pyrophosphatase (non-canonical NTP hydrolase)
MYCFRSEKLRGLAKINEEAGEVIQVIGKLMMTQGEAEHWSGNNLYKDLANELADLEAAISIFKRYNFAIPMDEKYTSRYAEKYNKFEQWIKEKDAHK